MESYVGNNTNVDDSKEQYVSGTMTPNQANNDDVIHWILHLVFNQSLPFPFNFFVIFSAGHDIQLWVVLVLLLNMLTPLCSSKPLHSPLLPLYCKLNAQRFPCMHPMITRTYNKRVDQVQPFVTCLFPHDQPTNQHFKCDSVGGWWQCVA